MAEGPQKMIQWFFHFHIALEQSIHLAPGSRILADGLLLAFVLRLAKREVSSRKVLMFLPIGENITSDDFLPTCLLAISC